MANIKIRIIRWLYYSLTESQKLRVNLKPADIGKAFREMGD
jgi:hypothetical protein